MTALIFAQPMELTPAILLSSITFETAAAHPPAPQARTGFGLHESAKSAHARQGGDISHHVTFNDSTIKES